MWFLSWTEKTKLNEPNSNGRLKMSGDKLLNLILILFIIQKYPDLIYL